MADDHHSGPAETGAEMDYPEHERTFNMFISFTKWNVIALVALLIAMAFGFFGGAGLFGGILTFAVLMVVAYFIA